jgi:hypothetical protein
MRLLTELVAVAILWMIWGWPVGVSAIAVLLLLGARRPASPAPEIPTLQDRAETTERRER